MGEPLKITIHQKAAGLLPIHNVGLAVEWLKNEVLTRRITHSDTLDVPCSNILELIDEAFPDLQDVTNIGKRR